MPNCPQHIVAFHAALRLGAVVVEHNPLYTDRELRHQFEDHGAAVAIVWDKAVERVRQLPADVGLRSIVSVELIPRDAAAAAPGAAASGARGPQGPRRPHRRQDAPKGGPAPAARPVLPWRELLDAGELKKRHPRPAAADLAVLQYTSGTTGQPKAAMLSHANLQANAAQGRAWVPGLKDGRETVYAVLPMFHAYGLTLCMTFALSIGAKLVLFPKFDVDLVLKALKKSPATFLPAVPPIYDRIAAAAAERGIGLESIRFSISGAMNLPAATVETWEKATGGYLIEGYGLTETSPIAIGNPFGPSRKPGTVGVPFPLTDIRVVDPAERRPGPCPGRGRGTPDPRPAGVRRLLEPAGGNRGGPARRRLVPHRRHRLRGRRLLRDDPGPDQGTDHHGRLQRLTQRGGGRPRHVPGRLGRLRGRAAAPRRRRGRGRRRRADPGHHHRS